MNRIVSLAVLLALIVLLGSMFFRVITPFLLPLFLAAVLAVICQPLQNDSLNKNGGRTAWAAGLTTASVTMMLVGPLVIGTFVAATSFYDLADRHLGGDWRHGLTALATGRHAGSGTHRTVHPRRTFRRAADGAPSQLCRKPSLARRRN